MKTTYVVSGYMRSGTSMMMQALTAGGLDPAFNAMRNGMNEEFGDNEYKPNGNGFYELSREQYSEIDFPEAHKGKLVKCLYGGVNTIKAGDYKIVFMLRDYEEIRQSFEAFFDRAPSLNEEDHKITIAKTIGMLEQRRDVDLTVLNYRDVVREPYIHFDLLKRKGWGIDPLKAAAIVNPELLRFKIEDLEVGI